MPKEKTNFNVYLEHWLRQPGNTDQYLKDIINDLDKGMPDVLAIGLQDVISANELGRETGFLVESRPRLVSPLP